jgi:hypothetical protein
MAKGGIRGGLLVVGDSTLVVQAQSQEVHVDEVDTASLLALADIEDSWDKDSLVQMFEQWIEVMSLSWRDRAIGPIREIIVPHVVSGLSGEISIHEGIWGVDMHRVAVITNREL